VTPIAVVTDSCASIPDSLIDSLNIFWVPYYIHRGKETLRDLDTIETSSFYKWLPTADTLPTTASPGAGDYLKMYEKIAGLGKFHKVVSIHMTSKGSGAYQAALNAKSMAAEALPGLRIEVIDTLNVAMCHGWMVIEAARAAMKGRSLAEVAAIIKRMIPITRMIQTADTLKYLHMGGRIGNAVHLVGSLLKIKPLIGMEDGIIVPLGNARSRQQAYRKMVDMVEAAVGYQGQIKIAYVHAAAREEAEKIKFLIEKRLTCVESLISELSPALGVHTGPGTAGLCYFPVNG
jgi:DegV family protein with EDD domain